MNRKSAIDFRGAKSDFELLDLIRLRYQMFANHIRSLCGILTGYSLAKENYEQNIREFSQYLTKLKNVNPHAVSWDMVISKEVEVTEYEIPVFYEYLDEYRKINHEVLGVVGLSLEQRVFDFYRQVEKVNIDFPALPISAPHKLKAVKIPGVKVHAFYYDENGSKYYEQCFRDFSYLKRWAKECFNINEQQW